MQFLKLLLEMQSTKTRTFLALQDFLVEKNEILRRNLLFCPQRLPGHATPVGKCSSILIAGHIFCFWSIFSRKNNDLLEYSCTWFSVDLSWHSGNLSKLPNFAYGNLAKMLTAVTIVFAPPTRTHLPPPPLWEKFLCVRSCLAHFSGLTAMCYCYES